MRNFLIILETIVAVALIGSILLQVKGTGLGSSFGGGGEFYQSKRGVEKIVLYATIGLGFAFAAISLGLLLLP